MDLKSLSDSLKRAQEGRPPPLSRKGHWRKTALTLFLSGTLFVSGLMLLPKSGRAPEPQADPAQARYTVEAITRADTARRQLYRRASPSALRLDSMAREALAELDRHGDMRFEAMNKTQITYDDGRTKEIKSQARILTEKDVRPRLESFLLGGYWNMPALDEKNMEHFGSYLRLGARDENGWREFVYKLMEIGLASPYSLAIDSLANQGMMSVRDAWYSLDSLRDEVRANPKGWSPSRNVEAMHFCDKSEKRLSDMANIFISFRNGGARNHVHMMPKDTYLELRGVVLDMLKSCGLIVEDIERTISRAG